MSVPRVAYRYVSGRPLDGRNNHPYLKPGDGRWPGWKRQVARLMVPAAGVVALADLQAAETGGAIFGVAAMVAVRRKWARRKFDRAYLSPTLAALRPGVGVNDVKLHVDPGLGNLTPRLAKPLSPAETAVRTWYGAHVEPVLRFGPDRAWRGTRKLGGWIEPAVKPFRRPIEKPGPRIQLDVDTPYLTKEQRDLVAAIIAAKIPVNDTALTWHQVGPRVRATWTVKQRPPAKVGFTEMKAAFAQLEEWEYFIGLGPGGGIVKFSLHDDSPHMAISAGSGAGKSVLAQNVAVQALARGGTVVILDRKGSHRWAIGVDRVDYCTRPAQMHEALLRLAKLADERNSLAFHEDEDWDPGPRTWVICEELNATIGQLTNYWAATRDKSDPKKSPAVAALADLLFMGRSAKVNVVAIAQMLTARAIGGPEARENFGIRFLARYTVNAWKMLVPEAAMPRASRVLGRWQMVVGGVATEVQVAFLTAAQARALAGVPGRAKTPVGPLSSDVAGNGLETGNTVDPLSEPVTIREAIDEGILSGSKEAVKMRLTRARKAGRDVPAPVGKRGLQTDLYRRGDLIVWAESEQAVA